MNGLRARRVRRCGRAGYPTRGEVQARPELLAEHVPAEWIGKRELAGVLTAALAVQAGGCGDEKKASPATNPVAAVVAPVFKRGSGRAAIGGMCLNWPVFLGEDEALKIIREELNQAGLHMTQKAVPVEGVVIPSRKYDFGDGGVTTAGGNALIADLKDPEKGVVVEYVCLGVRKAQPSAEDQRPVDKYSALGGVYTLASVESYDFREVANYTSQQVQQSGKGLYFGAFYDPAVEVGATYEWTTDTVKQDPKEAEAESKRLLRLQVRDFVEWLKGQGVI